VHLLQFVDSPLRFYLRKEAQIAAEGLFVRVTVVLICLWLYCLLRIVFILCLFSDAVCLGIEIFAVLEDFFHTESQLSDDFVDLLHGISLVDHPRLFLFLQNQIANHGSERVNASRLLFQLPLVLPELLLVLDPHPLLNQCCYILRLCDGFTLAGELVPCGLPLLLVCAVQRSHLTLILFHI
jgi:hypothetical protein